MVGPVSVLMNFVTLSKCSSLPRMASVMFVIVPGICSWHLLSIYEWDDNMLKYNSEDKHHELRGHVGESVRLHFLCLLRLIPKWPSFWSIQATSFTSFLYHIFLRILKLLVFYLYAYWMQKPFCVHSCILSTHYMAHDPKCLISVTKLSKWKRTPCIYHFSFVANIWKREVSKSHVKTKKSIIVHVMIRGDEREMKWGKP